jgi:hypothetical protein
MKRIVALLTYLTMQVGMAQSRMSVAPARKLTVQPLQLLFWEAVAGYEWPLHRRVGFQVSAGYRWHNPAADPTYATGVGLASDYNTKQMLNPHHQALKMAFGPVFYLNDRRSVYLQSEYFFRHWWLTNTRIQVDNYRLPHTSFDLLRTERVNVYGLKALVGVNGHVSRLTEDTNLTYSVFAGIGFRVKTYWYEGRDGTVGGVPIDYQFEQGMGYLPTLHAGVLLHIGIGRE